MNAQAENSGCTARRCINYLTRLAEIRNYVRGKRGIGFRRVASARPDDTLADPNGNLVAMIALGGINIFDIKNCFIIFIGNMWKPRCNPINPIGKFLVVASNFVEHFSKIDFVLFRIGYSERDIVLVKI